MSIPSKAHRAILLLGMHRSGTSASTRVLNLLGADLGADLMPSAEGNNARGFWEHRGVVAIHEELFGALHRNWQDIRAMPVNWLSSEAASVARKKLVDLLSKEFANSPLWAVKDPRLCRLLPLWQLVLDDMNVEAHVVFIVRNPTEVAQSLAARDGMPGGLARMLWLEYILEGELASRQLPRAVIVYDNLLQDWEGCVRQLESELHLHWPIAIESVRGEVGSFLSISERHHNADKAGEVELPDLVRRVYERFLEKANSDISWDKIEKVSDIYQLSAKVFLDGFEEMVRQIAVLRGNDAEIREKTALLERRYSDLLMAFSESHAKKRLYRGVATRNKFDDIAKIYGKLPEGAYSESYCHEFRHEGLFNITRLKFEFPAHSDLKCIRFDPSEVAGEFILQDMHINGVPFDFDESKITAVRQFIVGCETNELRFESIEDDPFVEFDVSGFDVRPGEVLVVELTCQRASLDSELRRLIKTTVEAILGNAAGIKSEELQQAVAVMDGHVRDQNDLADRHAATITAQLQASRDEQLSQQKLSHARLEAVEVRLAQAEANARGSHAEWLDRLEKQAEMLAVLRQHIVALAARQREADELLGGIQPQLESLAALCELTARQSQEINSKQAVSQESLESLRTQLGALSDFQQRSFIGRIRYRFSKTRGSSA